MDKRIYSKAEFDNIRDRLNKEIKRRGTFKWWDPLTTPSVGVDKTSEVNDKTYTINNPSTGSIVETNNIDYPAHGDNPANEINTSGARFDVDELQNYLVGLAKMHDIDLFYGRDEKSGTVFRDFSDIKNKLEMAESDLINAPIIEPFQKMDPNHGMNNGMHGNYGTSGTLINVPPKYPSGEFDGEELHPGKERPDETNFYDDYGAAPGVTNYRPQNPYVSPIVRKSIITQDNNRNEIITEQVTGGIDSIRFGLNPRNPNKGSEYPPRQVFGGSIGLCNVACTGMCYLTCDSHCSESCTTTCWSRCGNACHSNCGNVCTGCTTQCYSTCKTKCSDTGGKSCVNAGADTVAIGTTGNPSGCSNSCGQTASSAVIKNTLTSSTYSCSGCSFSCQFYPNKKTTCWDSVCSTLCFTTCNTYCSTSCFGGCISNNSEHDGGYKSGRGQSCKEGCVADCTGDCRGVCEGACTATCFGNCTQACRDNCISSCSSSCGKCDTGCNTACTGCDGCTGSCSNSCTGTCHGCTSNCTATCKIDCNANVGVKVS